MVLCVFTGQWDDSPLYGCGHGTEGVRRVPFQSWYLGAKDRVMGFWGLNNNWDTCGWFNAINVLSFLRQHGKWQNGLDIEEDRLGFESCSHLAFPGHLIYFFHGCFLHLRNLSKSPYPRCSKVRWHICWGMCSSGFGRQCLLWAVFSSRCIFLEVWIVILD